LAAATLALVSRSSRGTLLVLLVVALGIVAGLATAAVRHSQQEPVKKVVICHWNESGKWVQNEVSVNSIIGNNGHEQHPKDIIPPFEHEDGSFPGLNWDDTGIPIYENGCKEPEPQPQPIGVFVSCTAANGTSYTATFGYNSADAADVTIAIGSANGITPEPVNRGQPTVFHHGQVTAAFSVAGIPMNDQITWTVSHGGETNTATTSSSGCPSPPEPHVTVSVTCVTRGASTFDATFGYTNPGPATVNVAVGPSNDVQPGGNVGQPTSFPAGSVSQAFTVTGVPNGTSAVWTLTSGGSTSTASTSDASAPCGGGPPAPKPIAVAMQCVRNNLTSYDVVFGYANGNTADVTIEAGPDNGFSPKPVDRGQVTTFHPGTHPAAFTVTGIPSDDSITWSVTYAGETSTATTSFAGCPELPKPPEPHVTIFVECVTNNGSTFDAVFGYSNDSAAPTTVSVGTSNHVSPGDQYQGQPETFNPGEVAQAFTIKSIGSGGQRTWTLTTAGTTETATASAAFATKCGGGPPAPRPVSVFVQCVQNHDATYDATFGYTNPNPDAVNQAIGPQNTVSPGNPGQGQPETFDPGTHTSAFSITGIASSGSVTWTLSTAPPAASTATATQSFATKCGEPPEMPKVGIFVRCVTNDGATFDATFGYQNDNLAPVTIPVGAANRFSPAPEDRGQTTVFQPGNVQKAFTVKGIPSSQDLVWTLTSNGTRTATASATYETKCSEPPPQAKPIGVFVTGIQEHGSTYDATFGYENANNFAETIEVGPANAFSPTPIDRGQPTVFVPGRTAQAVVVRQIPADTDLTWTVAYDGTRHAVATAAPPSTATANPSSPACSTTPTQPTPTPTPGAPNPTPTPPTPNPTPPDPPGPRPPEPPRPFGIFAACVVTSGRTFDAVFGYVNLNVGAVVVPTGSSNFVRPRANHRGKPETFEPGFVPAAFAVRGIPAHRTATWTVKFGGETRVAAASPTLSRRCQTATLNAFPDLEVTKTVSPAVVYVGDRVTFTITVKNIGRRAMRPVAITDVRLDDRVDVLSTTSTLGACRLSPSASQSVAACGSGSLAPGQTAVVRIVGRGARAGRSVDRATTLFRRALDATPANNVARASVLIRERPHPSPKHPQRKQPQRKQPQPKPPKPPFTG
jgi:uncharacterized repeat protein (TIGR01451 family)